MVCRPQNMMGMYLGTLCTPENNYNLVVNKPSQILLLFNQGVALYDSLSNHLFVIALQSGLKCLETFMLLCYKLNSLQRVIFMKVFKQFL